MTTRPRVTFQLKHSDQSTMFNASMREEMLTGDAHLTYDGRAVVVVDGWRFAHTVPVEHVKPARRVHIYRHPSAYSASCSWTWYHEIDGVHHENWYRQRKYGSHPEALSDALAWLAEGGHSNA